MCFEIVKGDGRAGGRITDSDLETVVNLQNQIEHRRRILAQLGDSILERLAAGADIDPGSHDARREVVTRPGVIEEQLVIDGVIRYSRLTGGNHRLKRRRSP